jgi:5-oxoprolinase (ATP-hydrolysing)
VEARLADLPDASLAARLDGLGQGVVDELAGQGVPRERISLVRRVHLRYEGTDSAIIVLFGDAQQMQRDFETAYKKRFSFLMRGKALVVEALSVEAIGASDAPPESPATQQPRNGPLAACETVRMFSAATWHAAALYQRADMRVGDLITGPAIIAEANATTVVEPGWQGVVTPYNHLILTRVQALPQRRAIGTTADPVMLEIFNNLFMSIAEQMGLRLQNTAYSVNIKERLDFSCALFDAAGNLIANAPHMPVHLGSMGESIKTVMVENAGRMRPGDVFMLNDPYHGGTHLPDVTVISPVFDEAGQTILFYVGSRGHHADIGGTTPGSMPPDSVTIDQEGVLIDNFKLVDGADGLLRDVEARAMLAGARYPARNPDQNMADLRAQVAANQKGVDELGKMVAHFGLDVVQAYMGHVQDNAEEAVRRVITALKDGAYTVHLDNGAQIQVAIRVDQATRSAEIDFTGTSAQLPNNFNAPSAVCMAAVLYVFRTLVDDEIPLNAGCLKPLRVIIPAGSMLNPHYPASVVSGNVETSTCITNALYGALGVMAASQGTMNNFTFGNATYQYYETISGGSGAGPGFDGTDVVQTNMTNSRLTDPEILEFRFPVRLESYEIRHGSGGAGRWHGGNGGVRKVRFLEPMTAAILSNNRVHAPFGMAGGNTGAKGANSVVRADGSIELLPHIGRAEMAAGDVFVVETPGGGGYGMASV